MRKATKYVKVIREEAVLSPSMLMEKYGTAEHPVFSKADWQRQVNNAVTPLLYWRWVSDQIDDELDKVYKQRNRGTKQAKEQVI